MKKILVNGFVVSLFMLLTACGDQIAEGSVKKACDKINLVSRDKGLCECVSEKLGDTKEAVDLMEWIRKDKEKDTAGYPLMGWLAQVSKNKEHNANFEKLLEATGESEAFAECLMK